MTAARDLKSPDPLDRILARDGVAFEDDEPVQIPGYRSRWRRLLDAITWPARAPWGWWTGLTAPERLMYRGLGLLSAGFAMVWIPLALIVPGAALTAAAFGFSFQRPEASNG